VLKMILSGMGCITGRLKMKKSLEVCGLGRSIVQMPENLTSACALRWEKNSVLGYSCLNREVF